MVPLAIFDSILYRISCLTVSHLQRGNYLLIQYISMMPVDPSTLVYSYLGYLSLGFIFVLLLLIYPIKEYIRNTAGSLYSYIYGLSMTLILYLWPLYSFIQSNGSFSFTFITSNQPLIITFIVMAVTGFYFFIHHSLF